MIQRSAMENFSIIWKVFDRFSLLFAQTYSIWNTMKIFSYPRIDGNFSQIIHLEIFINFPENFRFYFIEISLQVSSQALSNLHFEISFFQHISSLQTLTKNWRIFSKAFPMCTKVSYRTRMMTCNSLSSDEGKAVKGEKDLRTCRL